MASFNWHLPGLSSVHIYVPHDEVGYARWRLNELLDDPRLKEEHKSTIGVFGSATPKATAQQRAQQIDFEGDEQIFTRAFVGSAKPGSYVWSAVFMVPKEQFRIFQKARGARSRWKLNRKLMDLSEYISLLLDCDDPLILSRPFTGGLR